MAPPTAPAMTAPTAPDYLTGEAPNALPPPPAPPAVTNPPPVTAPVIKTRSIMDESHSASGVGESSVALAAIGDQPLHVVASGEASKPVVQAADTRQLRDAKRSGPKWETSA